MKFFALRSKTTGRYFSFREYTDDGYGKLHADVAPSEAWPEEQPKLFTEYETQYACLPELYKHTKEETEWVPVTIEFGKPGRCSF